MAEEFTFVTGATGFIGSHVVRQLLLRGDRVRILARNSSRKSNVEAFGCEITIGVLKDLNSLLRCVQGCRFVYHVAADYRLWARDPQALYRANVEGTRALLTAAAEAGVVRIVYTSTVGALGIPNSHAGSGPPLSRYSGKLKMFTSVASPMPSDSPITRQTVRAFTPASLSCRVDF